MVAVRLLIRRRRHRHRRRHRRLLELQLVAAHRQQVEEAEAVVMQRTHG